MLWVGTGKGRETIDRFFAEALSEYQRAQRRSNHCPNATLVIDHFHATKALNETVDAVRKEEWRTA